MVPCGLLRKGSSWTVLPAAAPKSHGGDQHGAVSAEGATSAAHILVVAHMCLIGLRLTLQEENHVWF